MTRQPARNAQRWVVTDATLTEPIDSAVHVELDGVRYRYVRYGEEPLDGMRSYSQPCHFCLCQPGAFHGPECPMGAGRPHRRPPVCGECEATVGTFHVGGCGIERCPACGGQFAGCYCDETLDGTIIEFPEDE